MVHGRFDDSSYFVHVIDTHHVWAARAWSIALLETKKFAQLSPRGKIVTSKMNVQSNEDILANLRHPEQVFGRA